MATIISISNQKGGVGKTTTSINLSAAIALRCRRVLLVDLDPQGNATSGLGFEKKAEDLCVYHVLTGQTPAQDAIIPTSIKQLDLLPSGIALAGAEVELVAADRREYILKNALEPIVHLYDYIFIDCPPSLGLLTLNALSASDSVLVPIQCEFYALEGLGQLVNTVNLVKKYLNPKLDINGVVCTMYDSRTNLSVQVVDEVKKYFKKKVYNTCIPRNVRLAEAPSYGLSIEQYDSKCIGASSYRELAEEVINRNEGIQV